MPDLHSTRDIIANAEYFKTPDSFFGNFPDLWKCVKKCVRKLETRQIYKESGNPSYEAFFAGNFPKSLSLLEESREEDVPLYDSLRRRGVDFIWCRPVLYPFSDYLKWEFECYKFNEKWGEQIFISRDSDLYRQYALHDFMTFDEDRALVHDYDPGGEIQGGWMVRDPQLVRNLVNLFATILRDSVSFQRFNSDNARSSLI